MLQRARAHFSIGSGVILVLARPGIPPVHVPAALSGLLAVVFVPATITLELVFRAHDGDAAFAYQPPLAMLVVVVSMSLSFGGGGDGGGPSLDTCVLVCEFVTPRRGLEVADVAVVGEEGEGGGQPGEARGGEERRRIVGSKKEMIQGILDWGKRLKANLLDID